MKLKVSVCMATYNGSIYIRDQIDSILDQLTSDDELIICDDCSNDETVKIIKSYDDKRIKLFINESNLGHVRNFEKAMMIATGNLISLSDQDDIWYPNRLEAMKNQIKVTNSNLIVSEFDVMNKFSSINAISHYLNGQKCSSWQEIINIFLGRVTYFGCTFLMTKELVNRSTPFPKWIESHDVWIGLIANTIGGTVRLHQPTLVRRIHEVNLTPNHRRDILTILRARILLMLSYLNYLLRFTTSKK
jgi:glycosyltransferase involved in cell wall biosynthesis